MGRGNIRTYGEYEGLWYVDRDYLDYYISKFANDDGDYEYKILGDMSVADFANFDYDYDLSEIYYEDFLYEFVNQIEKKFSSFYSTGNHFGMIMENNLFEIQIKDNEWSYAVCLSQKENDYDNYLGGLQKKHYQSYLNGMKDILLDMFPEIGCYVGIWTHGTVRRG